MRNNWEGMRVWWFKGAEDNATPDPGPTSQTDFSSRNWRSTREAASCCQPARCVRWRTNAVGQTSHLGGTNRSAQTRRMAWMGFARGLNQRGVGSNPPLNPLPPPGAPHRGGGGGDQNPIPPENGLDGVRKGFKPKGGWFKPPFKPPPPSRSTAPGGGGGRPKPHPSRSKSWHKQPHNWASWALANLCVISGRTTLNKNANLGVPNTLMPARWGGWTLSTPSLQDVPFVQSTPMTLGVQCGSGCHNGGRVLPARSRTLPTANKRGINASP